MTVLLACSGGGHLKQLHKLVPRLGLQERERLWLTFDTGLSRDLLRDERVVYAPYAAPRDTRGILRNSLLGARLTKGGRIDLAISTGSSLAVSTLPLAAARGIPSHFIETAARAAGPSLTGQILRRVPGVHTYSQYPGWASGPWLFGGSVFDGYEPGPTREAGRLARVVVTLGTTESYAFHRIVRRLAPLLDGVPEVLWQTGVTGASGTGVPAEGEIPASQLEAAIAEADVVVAHAGTGAALTALDHGKCPVLVPRRAQHGEHVDDHQLEIAGELDRRGLALMREVDDLDHEALAVAAQRTTRSVSVPAPFRLVERSAA